MSNWAANLDNPFALSGFAALLLVGLVLRALKVGADLDAARARLVTNASYVLALIGIGGLLVALYGNWRDDTADADRATRTETRTNSPSGTSPARP